MIYEYMCEKCGDYEHEQSMMDDALTKCPTCGGHTERIVTGGAGTIFAEESNKKRGYKGTKNSKQKGARNYGSEKPHGLSDDWIANNT